MWQFAVLWCYVEGVITVKFAVHPLLTINHLYCCILLVFFPHALLTMHGHRNIKLTVIYSHYEPVALFTQHAKRVSRTTLPSVAWPSVHTYIHTFSTSSHKRYDLRENLIEHKTCCDFLYKFRLKYF